MNFFSCCRSEDRIRRTDSFKGSTEKDDKESKRHFTSFVNISLKTDSSKRKYITNELARAGKQPINIRARCLTYRELCDATQNFNPNNQLGEGGFGRVYKGNLECIDQVVAVKQLDRKGFQGNREFLVEVMMLSLLDNPYLVDLVGYCCEGNERLLVYEYMPKGSLENHLLDLPAGKKAMDWNSRIKIVSGAARGLDYLHDKADPPVIYRDFKASNVLLDNEFNPKLSDFGLAKIGPTGQKQHVSTRVMGTYGYCAPEYALTGQLTTKSDVYSFGVVFLEMITGRRVIDKARPAAEQNLVTWATPLFQDRSNFSTMVDPMLGGKYPSKGLIQAFAIAAMCLHEDTDERPSMNDVISGLGYVVLNKDGGNE